MAGSAYWATLPHCSHLMASTIFQRPSSDVHLFLEHRPVQMCSSMANQGYKYSGM
jgi:hypothetical protein